MIGQGIKLIKTGITRYLLTRQDYKNKRTQAF